MNIARDWSACDSVGTRTHTARRIPLRVLPADPRPCDRCPERAVCKEPCARLQALLPAAETRAWREVAWPSLAHGGDGLPSMIAHRAEAESAQQSLAMDAVFFLMRPRLREAVNALPAVQRDVMMGLLSGRSLSDVARERGTSRQAAANVYHVAFHRVSRALGDLPDRDELLLLAARLAEGELPSSAAANDNAAPSHA